MTIIILDGDTLALSVSHVWSYLIAVSHTLWDGWIGNYNFPFSPLCEGVTTAAFLKSWFLLIDFIIRMCFIINLLFPIYYGYLKWAHWWVLPQTRLPRSRHQPRLIHAFLVMYKISLITGLVIYYIQRLKWMHDVSSWLYWNIYTWLRQVFAIKNLPLDISIFTSYFTCMFSSKNPKGVRALH